MLWSELSYVTVRDVMVRVVRFPSNYGCTQFALAGVLVRRWYTYWLLYNRKENAQSIYWRCM